MGSEQIISEAMQKAIRGALVQLEEYAIQALVKAKKIEPVGKDSPEQYVIAQAFLKETCSVVQISHPANATGMVCEFWYKRNSPACLHLFSYRTYIMIVGQELTCTIDFSETTGELLNKPLPASNLKI